MLNFAMRHKTNSMPLRIAAITAVLLMLTMGFGTAVQAANVVARVDLSAQRMYVSVNGRHYGTWKVSTGRRGYSTPRGTWRAKWLSRNHRSRKYNNAPMPYSVFYLGGYAIHGTYATRRLGRRASHGCVRLAPSNARRFFNLVRRYGPRNTRITVTR